MHSPGVQLRRGTKRTPTVDYGLCCFVEKRYQSLGSRILYGSLSCKRDKDACHEACHINNKHKQYGATTTIVGSLPDKHLVHDILL